ncbi:MAG: arsenate reductase ArsC [Acidimicrobiales bacterium]
MVRELTSNPGRERPSPWIPTAPNQQAENSRARQTGRPLLCVHNAGRSQMAAGWLRQLAGDRVEVFSGGSDPGAETNANAIEAMGEVGIDISSEYPKPWTDEIARAADVIVSMGCGDACPIFPGKRYEDWELTDPSGQPIEVVREIRDDIGQRVQVLLATLVASAA